MEQRKITDIRKNGRHRKDLGDISSLAGSIADIGLLHPIVVQPDGTLIAGERRLEAVKLLGWDKIPVRVVDLPSIVRGEHDENVFRKDFTPSEAVAIGLELEPMEREEAKKRKATSNAERVNFTPSETGKSLDKVASAVGMSRPTYQKAKEVIEYAQAVDMPELVELMDTKGVEAAAKEVKASKRQAQRAELVKLADKHEAKEYDKFSVNGVYLADIHTLTLPENSVDMIFTDPPYLEKDVPLFGELARFASQALKPGAYLMTYSGKMFLPSVMSLLGEHLEYVWTFGVFQPDSNHKIQKHHIFQTWRPIVCYKKPGKTNNVDWQPDMIKATRDKTFHEWQQQIEPALKWIEAYTLPNDLIVDPFVGGGTTLVACKQLKRNYLGFDVDPEAVKITKMRLENV